MKKLLALLLTLVLSVGLFACGDKNKGNVDVDGWVNESGKEPITLTWFVDLATFNKQFGDTLTDREIFRRTGVKIEFTSSDSVTGQSKLNSMILGNSLTDLVSVPAESTAHEQMYLPLIICS